jgi:hypothetical protein
MTKQELPIVNYKEMIDNAVETRDYLSKRILAVATDENLRYTDEQLKYLQEARDHFVMAIWCLRIHAQDTASIIDNLAPLPA